MAARRYRKRPVEVEAVQFDGSNYDDVRSALGLNLAEFYEIAAEDLPYSDDPNAPAALYVVANSTEVQLEPGEWVIRDVRGCYPCKPDIFDETYEEV